LLQVGKDEKTMPKIFISYSHDSDEHREKVLGLSERLRNGGVETILDRYINGSPPEGWPRWMSNQLKAADFVLVVCTPTYYRRFLGQEVPEKGKGADWEGALITNEIYDARSTTLKFVPVFLGDAVVDYIPDPLRSGTHYALTSQTQYESLYDFLLGQAGVEPGPLGPLKIKPRLSATPLMFGSATTAGPITAPSPAVAPTQPALKADLSRIDRYAPVKLIGREDELQLLDQAWGKVVNAETLRPRVLALVAMGGEGKTSLVAKWAAQLAHTGWSGCDAVFAWSFYSQGTREQTAASSDLFLAEALRFFGDAEMAQSSQSALDKARRLAQLVGGQRALLILDGLEPLQYAPTSPTHGELRDGAMAALLKALAINSQGLCVLTTRHAVADLRNYLQTTVQEHHLLRLSEAAGVELLQSLGVHGSVSDLAALVHDVRGHALSLNLLGSYLRDAHGGDVRKRDQVKLEEADAETQGHHAFRVMDAYVQWFARPDKNAKEAKRGQRAIAVLKLLGLFDRPASADCLNALLKSPSITGLTEAFASITEAQRNIVYARLQDAKLLTMNRDAAGALLSLDAHPLVREYFGKTLKEEQPQAWRDAHHRIYEHLCATTKEGKQPSLEELQPLYQAVAHGCKAGLLKEAVDEVYHDRILRGKEAYSIHKLGAFASDLGAVACFFERPWSHLTPTLSEAVQAWLLHQASFRLRALGRLSEALEPIRAGLATRVTQEDWKEAARSASSLSELELTLGHIDGDGSTSAVRSATQSMVYAERSKDTSLLFLNRTTHADALHQANRRIEALHLFQEAEAQQAEDQPEFPLLYSIQGFQYADLLLSEAERAAWRTGWHRRKPIQRCEALSDVKQRATRTLEWMQADSMAPLLTLALHHLTLGRTRLYTTVLQAITLSPDSPAWVEDVRITNEIQQAVDGLRRAGNQQFIPLTLLTRAWLRRLQGNATGFDSAQTDLDEAWEIAERGPMPLFQADIHLHRARLFMRDTCYPWDKAEDGTSRGPADDLREARRLIEKHGYGRRREELQDAEEALQQWQAKAQAPSVAV